MKTNTQSDQEMMSQSHQQHMAMPAQPTAHFIVIETDFAFGLFKNGFDSLYVNDKKVGEDLLDG